MPEAGVRWRAIWIGPFCGKIQVGDDFIEERRGFQKSGFSVQGFTDREILHLRFDQLDYSLGNIVIQRPGVIAVAQQKRHADDEERGGKLA